jgi:hypothetical protein
VLPPRIYRLSEGYMISIAGVMSLLLMFLVHPRFGAKQPALIALDEAQKALIVSFLMSYQAIMLILFCRNPAAR